MVDRVYKAYLPKSKKALGELREEFSRLNSKNANWVKLRIGPLLKHVNSLEQLLESQEFSSEFTRLRKGVVMFHSDLVYLRTNVKALKNILESEEKKKNRRN
jgi:hypothetical protein